MKVCLKPGSSLCPHNPLVHPPYPALSFPHPAASLTLQLSPYVSELALYDIAGTPGVAADVSHINSKATVKGYAGQGLSRVFLSCMCHDCIFAPARMAHSSCR